MASMRLQCRPLEPVHIERKGCVRDLSAFVREILLGGCGPIRIVRPCINNLERQAMTIPKTTSNETAARRALLATALASTLLCAACGGNDAASADPGEGAAFDVAGAWNVTEVQTSNCVGEQQLTTSYKAVVSQNGDKLSVKTPAGTFAGTLDGGVVSWSGSYADDGGTTTIHGMELNLNSDASSFQGSSQWNWSNGVQSCSGTTQSTGARV